MKLNNSLMLTCLWRIFGSPWAATVLHSSTPVCCCSLRSHDLTGRKIISFPEWRLISLSSERQKVSAFSCWHHDSKTNAEIQDSLKINPHCGLSHVCVLLHLISNDPVFFVLLLHMARLTESSVFLLRNPQHTVFVSDVLLYYKRGQCCHWNKLD